MKDLEALRQRLARREDRARVRAEARARRRERRARQAVDRLRQRAELAGERARLRHLIAQSGEARAMRVERTGRMALAVLLPVLLGFGAWSAAGVQAGMVALLNLQKGTAAAWAAWLVEPALIGIVAGVILIRARLRSAGGDLDMRATRIEFAALAASILLNAAGHWPEQWTGGAVCALAGYSLGPLGAAATAYLISVVQDGVAAADPWHDNGRPVPSLADLTPDPAAPDQVAPDPAAVPPTDPDPFDGPCGYDLWPLMPHADTGGQIDGDQGGRPTADSGQTGDDPPGDRPVIRDTRPATAARRAGGQSTRDRVAAYLAAHPDATARQIAGALGISESTAKRHRRDLLTPATA